MLQSIRSQLSDADWQLIEINQLGIPLGIYRLKPGLIFFLRRAGFFIIVCSILMLALAITAIFIQWSKEQVDNYIMFGILVVSTSFSLLMGLTILYVAVPGARNKHIVVCEQGLFQVGKKIGSKQVEVVYWSDVLAIKKFFHEYFIVHQGNKVIEIELTYQNINELVSLIRKMKKCSIANV